MLLNQTGKHRALFALACLAIVTVLSLIAPAQAQAGTTLHKSGFDGMPAQYIVFDNLDISKATFKANDTAFSKKKNYKLNNGQAPSAGIVWNRKASTGESVGNPFSIKFSNAGYETDTGKRVDLVLTCTKVDSRAIRYLGSARTQISLIDQYASKSHFEIGNLPLAGYKVTYGIKQTYDVRVYYSGTTTATKHPLLFYISDLDTVDSTGASDSWSGAYAEGVNLVSGYGKDTYVASDTKVAAEGSNTRFHGTAGDSATARSAVAFTLNASGGTIAWTGSNDGCATWFFESFVKTITATAGLNGTVKASGTNKTIAAGTSLSEKIGWRTDKTYTATPSAGYKVSSVKADGKAVKVTNAAGQSFTFKNVKSDHTFAATFAPITYEVAFDGNGATSGTMTPMSNLQGATSYTLTANAFEREGYTFTRWNTAPDGSGQSFRNREAICNLAKGDGDTITLYAQYEPDPFVQRTVVVRIPATDYAAAVPQDGQPPTFTAVHASVRKTLRNAIDFSNSAEDEGYRSASVNVTAPPEAACTLANTARFRVVDKSVEGHTTIFTLAFSGPCAQIATAMTVNHIVVDAEGNASGWREDLSTHGITKLAEALSIMQASTQHSYAQRPTTLEEKSAGNQDAHDREKPPSTRDRPPQAGNAGSTEAELQESAEEHRNSDIAEAKEAK